MAPLEVGQPSGAAEPQHTEISCLACNLQRASQPRQASVASTARQRNPARGRQPEVLESESESGDDEPAASGDDQPAVEWVAVDGLSYNLWSAACCGNLRALRVLLDRGVPVDQVYGGQTALHHAAASDQVEAAHLLLERGAAVDKQDSIGRAALHLAARNGCLSVARLLISSGANTNQGDKIGRTALHCAAKHGRRAVISLLLGSGADVCQQTRADRGYTALEFAAYMGRTAVVQQLLGHCGLSVYSNRGATALVVAAAAGHASVIRQLIRAGATQRSVALAVAIEWGHTDAMRALLDGGASLDRLSQKIQQAGHQLLAQHKAHEASQGATDSRATTGPATGGDGRSRPAKRRRVQPPGQAAAQRQQPASQASELELPLELMERITRLLPDVKDRLAVAAAYKGAWEHYGKSKASWLAGARLAQRFAPADATQLACLDSHVQHLAQLMRQQSDSGQQLLQLDLTLAPQGDVEADDLLELQRPLQDGVHCLTMQLDDNLQIAPLLAGYTFSQLQRAKLRSAVSSEYSLAHSTCFGLAAPELLSLRLAHAALRQAAELSPSLVFLELENVHISAQAASQLFAATNLQELRLMKVRKAGGGSWQQLGSLSALTRLVLWDVREAAGEDDLQRVLPELLAALPDLCSLKVKDARPDCLSQLGPSAATTLTSLTLRMLDCWAPLPPLEQVAHLTSLRRLMVANVGSQTNAYAGLHLPNLEEEITLC